MNVTGSDHACHSRPFDTCDGIYHLLAVSHHAEDRVVRRKRIVGVHNEELRAVRVRSAVGHGHDAGLVALAIRALPTSVSSSKVSP